MKVESRLCYFRFTTRWLSFSSSLSMKLHNVSLTLNLLFCELINQPHVCTIFSCIPAAHLQSRFPLPELYVFICFCWRP